MIELKDVSYTYYSEEASNGVESINLVIPNGQVVLLCGESGCGKTTITRLINGLIPSYYEGELKGEIRIDGKDISKLPLYEVSKKVGSVFQNPRSQFFNVDTSSEIAFGCENFGIHPETICNRMGEVIKELKINSLIDRNLFQLSGGEKQKIACASIATMEPEIIVLDEPSSNLDIESIRDIKEIINKWKQKGKTIVIAEHRLYYLMDIADRILYMKNGKIDRDMSIDNFMKIEPENVNKMSLRSLNPKINIENKTNNCNNEIVIKNFYFSYGKEVAMNIENLKVPEGGIIGILGNNGAGKTTFTRSLCGLLKKSRGEMICCGKKCRRKERIRSCYMVMQDVNHQLFTESVLDEILLSMDGEDEEIKESKALEILESLNLLNQKDLHPMSLSGGQKQRVAIGSAIASKKQILLFDEPTSGLDYKHMMDVSLLIKKLSNLGKTIMIVSHDPEFIMNVCNYIVFIEKGKIKWSGSMVDVENELYDYFSFCCNK